MGDKVIRGADKDKTLSTGGFVPTDLHSGGEEVENYLDVLNRELLTRLQGTGEVYLSHAVIRRKVALRVCIVNFRTSLADVNAALLPLVVRLGNELDSTLRPGALRPQRQAEQ